MKAGECTSVRKTTRLFDYSNERYNDNFVWTHKDCICNEAVALCQRHQVDDGSRYSSRTNLWKHLRRHVKTLSPSSEEYIIGRYSGPKKKLLEQARESLAIDPVTRDDAKVNMFLKADKYHQADYGAPRCIQYRNKRYCLRLATYLHPIEAMVYKITDHTGTPAIAKSRNMMQRGEDLRAKWEAYTDPIAILLDHSKFDAHCSAELLSLEHRFYTHCYSVGDGQAELKKLLNWQMFNRGVTKNGTRYETVATRMSGDQNTGLGNSLINYALLQEFNKFYKLNAAIYVDGDDSVLICERSKCKNLQMDFFKQFGMVTKVDYATMFEKVEFCQSRPVYDGVKWRMVRNPERFISRLPWLVYNLPQSCWPRYLKSVGMCEVALGVGVPVGQYLGRTLTQSGKGRYMITDLHYQAMKEFVTPLHSKVVPPTMEARLSYERAWGIDVCTQLELESMTLRLNPKLREYDDYDEEPYCSSSNL